MTIIEKTKMLIISIMIVLLKVDFNDSALNNMLVVEASVEDNINTLSLNDLTETNYLDYIIEDLDNIIDENIDVFGLNDGYSYVNPSISQEFTKEKYNIYKEIVSDYYNEMDSSAISALNTYGSGVDIDSLLLCCETDYNVSQGAISPGISMRIPSSHNKYFDRVEGINNVNENISILNIGDDSGIEVQAVEALIPLSSMLAALGLCSYSIVTIQGGFATIYTGIVAPVLPYIKAILIAAGIIAIAAVCACYWNQINDIFEAIKASFLAFAAVQIEKITLILEGIKQKADESFANEEIIVNGESIAVARLTATYLDVLERETDEYKYHVAYIAINKSPIVLVDPRRITRQQAIVYMRRSATITDPMSFFENIYTFQRSDAYSLIAESFPTKSYYEDLTAFVSSTPGGQWTFRHFHACDFVALDSNNEVLYVVGKVAKRSLFGLPQLVFPEC